MENENALYESVAGGISGMIAAGTLKAGERIPSVRHLSLQRRVSVSTVLRAYEVLENQGLIEARPNAGYYVRARKAPAEEPALSAPPAAPSLVGISRLVEEVLDARRRDVIPLGAACPSSALMPTARLRNILASVSRRRPNSLTDYLISAGNDELRRQIARHSLDFGCNLAAHEIIVTNGATEAINICLRAVAKPGDTIALESPTYFSLLQVIESLNMKALEIPTHPRDGISLDALEFALQRERVAACIVMANAHNPLGSSMPEANKQRLVAMLAARGVPLIEDDVYGDIYFGSARPVTCKAFDRDGNVLLISSFTKTVAPGFRIGWCAPGRYFAQARMLKFINSIASPEILQLVLAEFLSNGGYDRQLRRLRRAFHDQVQHVARAVTEHFPAGTRITRPTGGFVLWVELPLHCDSERLHRDALTHSISLVPGTLFSASGRYRNFIRLNCSEPWNEKLERAVATLGTLAAKLGERAA